MKRIGTVLMTIALVAALVAVPLGAAAALADDGDVDESASDHVDDSVKPGEQLGGVVGVQNAEVDGEVSDRTFGVQLANAQTDNETADVVADRLEELEERLEEHETDLEAIEQAREAGTVSEGEYRATVATVAAEKATTERTADRAATAAGELPDAVLEERGISVDAIEELRTAASELGGPETAEIAASIAGDDVGSPVAGDRGQGPTDDVDPDTETDTEDDDDERGAGAGSSDRGR